MAVRFPRGAEWRVWDLQVHTPFSELNNGFGSDHDAYAAQFFIRAIEKRIAVVGVTDYFSVDGFKFLKAIQDDDARLAALIGHDKVESAKAVKLLPNVELRTDILVDGNRVNFHVIFSDEVCADDIVDNFLAQLSFTSEGNPQGLDQQLALTRKNLEDLGRTLKQQHAPFADKSDLFIGMMTATVNHQQVSKILSERSSKFGSKYLFCLPCDEDLSSISWDGQGHVVRKVLIQKAHLLFSSNKNTRDFALGRKHPSPEEYIREFQTFKPCVHGSDAHRPEDLFEPAESRYTWIKADPTFLGLLQTLNEPDGRVYVGSSPPSLEAFRSRPTKIIIDLGVHKKSGATLAEKWFDHQIPLNPELVAIIGNKGSGKSALADILGLIGNTPRFQSFSFLSPDRFRDRKNNKAKHFEASATWADDKTDGPISLDDTPVAGSVETVKYIPQDYLETICNEVSLGSGSNFYAELQNVIFSHVPEEERLGFSTLDELLEHRSEETQKTIAFLVDQLREINREIVAREEQLTDSHRKTLEGQLAAKQRELDAHDTAKPAAMAPPSEGSEGAKMASIGAELQKLQAELVKEEGKITASKQRLAGLAKRRSTAERLLGKLSNLAKQLNAASVDANNEVEELGLAWGELVKAEINKGPVDTLLAALVEDANDVARDLDQSLPDGAAKKVQDLMGAVAKLKTQLSAPQRAYEEYKSVLKQWEEMRASIIGSEDVQGSLSQLKAAIAYLPTVAEQANSYRKERIAKAKEIYKEKESLRDGYGRYYGAVQRFLTSHPLAKSQQFKLTFNVAITEHDFSSDFLRLLNQRRVGTFSGLEEGTERLKQLLESTDFSSSEELSKFLVRLMKALREDQRPGRDQISVLLKDQLAQGVSVAELYDYVFGLSYLDPVYNLRWDGKTIEQLSPGERGNLLLIFYLLIDRDDIPLVIDQPEENLDNHTVFRTLVPCVKEAKSRRQIVMVTHNPNLAVVCDAEQVICAEIRKDQGYEVRYICGSIEDPLINRRIVDVLEGTRPAFDKRDSKYIASA